MCVHASAENLLNNNICAGGKADLVASRSFVSAESIALDEEQQVNEPLHQGEAPVPGAAAIGAPAQMRGRRDRR